MMWILMKLLPIISICKKQYKLVMFCTTTISSQSQEQWRSEDEVSTFSTVLKSSSCCMWGKHNTTQHNTAEEDGNLMHGSWLTEEEICFRNCLRLFANKCVTESHSQGLSSSWVNLMVINLTRQQLVGDHLDHHLHFTWRLAKVK